MTVLVPLLALALLGTSAAGEPAPLPTTTVRYTLPVGPPAAVVEAFSGPAERWLSGHRGVDLSAEPGSPVRAPAAGVVSFAGPVADRSVVTVTHPDGRRSSLEPVDADVRAGDPVTQGQPLGRVQDVPGHCAPASCVHWGVRTGPDAYVDPMGLVAGGGPVVLLPDRD